MKRKETNGRYEKEPKKIGQRQPTQQKGAKRTTILHAYEKNKDKSLDVLSISWLSTLQSAKQTEVHAPQLQEIEAHISLLATKTNNKIKQNKRTA